MTDTAETLYALCVYVPTTHADAVKDALFGVGAGRIGSYDHCCWQTRGAGQFRPLAGSNPFQGRAGKVETVEEMRIEMVCAGACLQDAIAALHRAHPYEMPAYHYWPVNRPVRL